MAPTREWRAIARAELTIGRKLGVGGASWLVSRASGDGVSTPVTRATVGTWAGYVVEEDPAQLGNAAPGVAVGAKRWYAVGGAATVVATPPTLDTVLTTGDVLTSVADAALVYDVVAPDTVAGYARYLLRKP